MMVAGPVISAADAVTKDEGKHGWGNGKGKVRITPRRTREGLTLAGGARVKPSLVSPDR
jgi:hypothetical protein